MDHLIDLLAALIPAAIGLVAIFLGSRFSRPEETTNDRHDRG